MPDITTTSISAKLLGVSYTKPAYDDPPTVVPGYWRLPEVHPAVTIYSEGFQTSASGWTGSGTTPPPTLTRVTWTGHSSSSSAQLDTFDLGTSTMSRTVSGLAPGRTYTFTAWATTDVAGSVWSLSVTGLPGAPTITPALYTWTKITKTFTATATSHTINLAMTCTTAYGSIGRWDDVAVVQDTYVTYTPADSWTPGAEYVEPVVTPGAHHAAVAMSYLPLSVVEGGWTGGLDATRAPYGEFRITVDTPDDAGLDLIDPRQHLRVQVDVTKTWISPARAPQSRSFNLYLRQRAVSIDGQTVDLVLQTNEAVLMDKSQGGTTVNTAYNSYTDLRTLVSDVLTSYGYTLEAGTVTADITRTVNATNMLLDPGTTASTGGGYGSGNAQIDLNDTSWSITPDGDSFNIFSPTSSDSFLSLGNGLGSMPYGIRAGGYYTFSATGRVKTGWPLTGTTFDTATDKRERRLYVSMFDASNNVLGLITSNPVPSTPGTPARVSLSFRVPTNATQVYLRAYLGNTAGQVQWDGFRLSETNGIEDANYFSGAGAVPADPHYAYAWSGTANASTSTRTRLDNRSPDALQRKPGIRVWDWLAGLVQSRGLRLFADEAGKWRLVDSSYAVTGEIRLANAQNLTSATDTIDLASASDGEFGYAELVTVHYTWVDRTTGQTQEAYDSAGVDGGIGLVIEKDDTPYPGAGLAALALASMQARGRTQDLSALTDFSATPGMDVVTTVPNVDPGVGKLSAVEWSSDGTMRVTTRGLTDTPVNAWIFAAGDWAHATGTWAQATGSN